MGHAIESTGARHNVIPEFSEWFIPFAGSNLYKRYGMPFTDFYNAANRFANNGDFSENCLSLSYPTETSINVQNFNGYSGEFDNYVPICGNVHFPPNARRHYDQDNTRVVQSSCQHTEVAIVQPLFPILLGEITAQSHRIVEASFLSGGISKCLVMVRINT